MHEIMKDSQIQGSPGKFNSQIDVRENLRTQLRVLGFALEMIMKYKGFKVVWKNDKIYI
jgi:hypothetical protein